MAVSASAVPSDPGETAIHFLEKVRSKNLNLQPGGDTALAPQTSEQKRKEIASRLERMARDLGDDPLEVGPVKLDDDLAAVLVRKIGGFDPGRLQIFPVALVRRGADWAAAPVPASYENSGLSYADAIRKRLESLQDWMLREQVVDLENLRDQSAERLRRKIEQSLPASELAKLDPPKAVERFFEACSRKQVPEILGLLGGLSRTLPEDWPERVRSAESALTSGEVSRLWRAMAAPEVLRVPVFQEEDGDTAQVSIAYLDPAGNPPKTANPKVEILNLNLSKTVEGHWRIDPPQDSPTEANGAPDLEQDSGLLDMFPSKLALKYPSAAKESASLARDALIAAFGNPDPAFWACLVQASGDPPEIRRAIAMGARTWWEVADPASEKRVFPMAFTENGDHAVVACQFFDARSPDHLDLKFLFFSKSHAGWLWNPAPSEEIIKSFTGWTSSQISVVEAGWMEKILSECARIEQIPADNPPAPDQARDLVERWLKATRSGDVAAALRLTARLANADSGPTLIRNLGYEISGAHRSKRPPSITGLQSGGAWTAVGVKTHPEGKPGFPLYPVVSTPLGPRILLEIDLIASDNRSRDFLNKTALDRLRKINDQAAADLSRLLTDHQTAVAKLKDP